MYNIALIPGDGVGPEVTTATVEILEKLNLDLEFTVAAAGNECFNQQGTTIPQDTIDLALESDATLFGAVTTVPGQKSAILTLRRELDLYANLRPIKAYPGVSAIFPDLELLIVRENSEGLYSGLEEYTSEGAEAWRVVTHKGSEKICRCAFEQSQKRGFTKVVAAHKANVLRKTDGVFRDAFYRVANDYPDIYCEDLYIDAMAMFLVTEPHNFQTIVTTNLFGDILSDEAAGLVGGLGMAPSANIGDQNGLFEPVHGSAPDIAGKGIANPSATILSAVLMLEYLNENEEAARLEKALYEVLEKRKHLTPDLGGTSSTKDMGKAIQTQL